MKFSVEDIGKELVYRLSTSILCEKKTEEIVLEIWFPTTWFQMFKKRWFPTFILKRFPVKEESHSQIYEVNHMVAYPEFSKVIPNEKIVRFFMIDRIGDLQKHDG